MYLERKVDYKFLFLFFCNHKLFIFY